MIFSCSMTEPGQPWQTTSGRASSCLERTWTKWMSSPSISVMKLGTELSLASHLRQSYTVAQYHAIACMVASCTPCDASSTPLLRPARGQDTGTQVLEVLLMNPNRERSDR